MGIEVNKNIEKIKKNRNILIIIGAICVIVLISIVISISGSNLSNEEKAIYENIYAEQTNFKDPSSVKVISGKVCNNLAKVTIGAKNSYGAMTTSEYLIILDQKEKVLFGLDYDSNSSDEELELSYEAATLYIRSCDYDKEYELSETSIKKINKKLHNRFN